MADSDWVTVGRVRTAYGTKGWLKVQSFTEPAENLLDYECWRFVSDGQARRVFELSVDEMTHRQSDILIHLKGIDDRESARRYANFLIQVPKARLPELESDEFYWHQLEGLDVYQIDVMGNKSFLVGVVDSLLETGANDVLLVKRRAVTQHIGCVKIDNKPRGDDDSGEVAGEVGEVLIPYLPDQVVKRVDLESGEILVDWYYDDN